MSTETEQQKMEKIIKEATMRYPDIARHRITVKKLFSKVLDIQFYTTDKITDEQLFALSGTVLYFSLEPEQQHFIFQYLIGMLYSKNHHTQVLASALINKIHSAKLKKKKLKLDNDVLMSPMGGISPHSGAALSMVAQYDRTQLTTKFPWSLSREEIKKAIQGDENMQEMVGWLADTNVTNNLVSLGFAVLIFKLLKTAKPWFAITIAYSVIFGILGELSEDSKDSLEAEARRRGMSDL